MGTAGGFRVLLRLFTMSTYYYYNQQKPVKTFPDEKQTEAIVNQIICEASSKAKIL